MPDTNEPADSDTAVPDVYKGMVIVFVALALLVVGAVALATAFPREPQVIVRAGGTAVAQPWHSPAGTDLGDTAHM